MDGIAFLLREGANSVFSASRLSEMLEERMRTSERLLRELVAVHEDELLAAQRETDQETARADRLKAQLVAHVRKSNAALADAHRVAARALGDKTKAEDRAHQHKTALTTAQRDNAGLVAAAEQSERRAIISETLLQEQLAKLSRVAQWEIQACVAHHQLEAHAAATTADLLATRSQLHESETDRSALQAQLAASAEAEAAAKRRAEAQLQEHIAHLRRFEAKGNELTAACRQLQADTAARDVELQAARSEQRATRVELQAARSEKQAAWLEVQAARSEQQEAEKSWPLRARPRQKKRRSCSGA